MDQCPPKPTSVEIQHNDVIKEFQQKIDEIKAIAVEDRSDLQKQRLIVLRQDKSKYEKTFSVLSQARVKLLDLELAETYKIQVKEAATEKKPHQAKSGMCDLDSLP